MMLAKILNKLLNIVLPQKCLKCGHRGEIICEKCLLSLKKCTKYIGENDFAVFSYEDSVVREAIKLLKYHGIKIVAPTLSKFMSETMLEHLSDAGTMADIGETEEIIAIPVPLHKERLKQRGFNQSEIIARNFTKNSGSSNIIFMNNILERIKNTGSQVSEVTRIKRLINLNNAFAVNNPEKIKGKVIILIDDVITTGATIAECRKTLQKAGARKVLALALAH